MLVSRKKVNSVMMLLGICMLNFFITLYYVNETRRYTSGDMRTISIIAVAELIIVSIIWIKFAGEIFSPFYIMFVVVYIFCMGQTICWALGLDMGEMDLQKYIPYLNKHYLGDGLLYTLNGVVLFLVGAVMAYNDKGIKIEDAQTEKNIKDYIAIKNLSTVILIISIPCVCLNLWNVLPSVIMGGYSELYTELNSYSKMGQFVPLIAGWFPIALLMKYAVDAEDKPQVSKISAVVLWIYIAINLYIGGRSGAVMMVLAFFITKQYLVKPIRKKMILPVCVGGYAFIGILNAIADIRLKANRSVIDVLSAFITSASSVVGDFIGELGWSMSSLVWTMDLTGNTFRKGTSYLFAFTAIIPNLGFWKEHPAAVYSNLGEWMQKELGRTTGLGYTFVAETYINFWWYGLIVMFLFGCIASKLLSGINKENAKYNIKITFVIIMFLTSVLKSFVRSSFSAIMRPMIFTVLVLTIGITLMQPRDRHGNYGGK